MKKQKNQAVRSGQKVSAIGVKYVILSSLIVVVLLYVLFFRDSSKSIPDKVGDLLHTAGDAVTDIVIGTEGKVTTITETTLREVFEINELSTVDYTYNAVARVYDERTQEVLYYVAYNGTVKAGIDFSKIIIDKDEDEKTIYLKLPDCEIQDMIVDFGKMEYIFVDSGKETEDVTQLAYKVCKKDLKDRVQADTKLLSLAKENAIDAVEALVVPWINQVDDEYTVIIQ